MGETSLLRDMAIVMTIAAAMSLLCQYLKQPVVIGYLLAGLIVGPHTPPFALVRDLHSIHTMAELGLVFLMFALGLEFSLPKLRKVGLAPILGASFEVLGMFAIGYLLGQAFNWSRGDSIFLGAILSMSSTTIIVKVFMDLKLIKEDFVKLVFGILILEDVVAVLILSFLSGFGGGAADTTAILISSLVKVVVFIVLFLVFGLLCVPRFLGWVSRFQVKEVLGITALGLCFFSSFLATKFDLSVALGAFLIGAVIAASKEIQEIEDWMPSVRDMFSAIFFVAAGMMIQPDILWQYKWHILVISLATILGKVVTDATGCFLAGQSLKTSFKVGVSLGQIGEFSFVIAALGVSLKVTSDFFFPLAVGVSSITTLCTPYLIKNSDRMVELLLRIMPKGIHDRLDGYQSRLINRKLDNETAHTTSVMSKYLIRLVIYAAVFMGLLAVINLVSGAVISATGEDVFLILLWILTSIISLPFFVLIGKYANHILFLNVTRFPRVLKFVKVNDFYNSTLILLWLCMGTIYGFMARKFLWGVQNSWQIMVLVILAAVLSRRRIASTAEWMEQLLDEVLGLATSEPNRQAAKIEEKEAFLRGVMEPVSLNSESSALGRTIRDLRLRERTGASVVAIYRDGQHISNPSPDTVIVNNDILILIGNEAERQQAKEILQ